MTAQTVTVSALVTFKTWPAPNFARIQIAPRPRQEGFQLSDGVRVAELDPAVLDALAVAWLNDLYAKTGRPCPFALTELNQGAG